MFVLVYCARRWAVSMYQLAVVMRLSALDVTVLTAPPFDQETFPYERLKEADVLYLRLHGMANQPYLYDSNWATAFSMPKCEKRVDELPRSPFVFIEGCYGALSPIPASFLKLGARLVIASDRQTENRPFTLGKAGRAGLRIVRAWQATRDLASVLSRPDVMAQGYRLISEEAV